MYENVQAYEEQFVATVNYILDSVDSDGSWGSKDFDKWGPIITCLSVQLLLECKFRPDSTWYAYDSQRLHTRTLDTSLVYLNACIRADGTFGEDIWDSAKLASLIIKQRLQTGFQSFPRLLESIRTRVANAEHKRTDHTWAGPGTIAVLVDLFDLSDEPTHADRLFGELVALQQADGSFHGPGVQHGGLVMWHTAQALMTIHRRQMTDSDSRVAKAKQYICDAQDATGRWPAFSRYDVYFTSYAILALSQLTDKTPDTIRNALEWLRGQASAESGKIQDAGGTIMGAIAWRACLGPITGYRLPLETARNAKLATHVIAHLESRLAEAQARLEGANAELSTLRRKFENADVSFSKKEVLIGGIVLSLLIGILASVVANALSSGSSQSEGSKPTVSAPRPPPPSPSTALPSDDARGAE